jgi:hypothetical protein
VQRSAVARADLDVFSQLHCRPCDFPLLIGLPDSLTARCECIWGGLQRAPIRICLHGACTYGGPQHGVEWQTIPLTCFLAASQQMQCDCERPFLASPVTTWLS